MAQTVFLALRITDYDESKEFWVDRLGLTIDWEHRFDSDYPAFLQISKGDLSLYLTEHENDCTVDSLIFFYVPDVHEWYKLCVDHGIIPDDPPEDKPWGNREFRIYDPDGNKICITTRLVH